MPLTTPDIAIDHIRVRILPDGRMRRAEAAKYLGISEKTLANLGVEGPRSAKMCGRVFYRRADLDEFIAAGGHRR